MKTGSQLIAIERDRQISKEGYSWKNDQRYVNDELALAAACYAIPEYEREMQTTYLGEIPTLFPFDTNYWKPSPDNRIKELTKAGALIAAEIDRLLNE